MVVEVYRAEGLCFFEVVNEVFHDGFWYLSLETGVLGSLADIGNEVGRVVAAHVDGEVNLFFEFVLVLGDGWHEEAGLLVFLGEGDLGSGFAAAHWF